MDRILHVDEGGGINLDKEDADESAKQASISSASSILVVANGITTEEDRVMKFISLCESSKGGPLPLVQLSFGKNSKEYAPNAYSSRGRAYLFALRMLKISEVQLLLMMGVSAYIDEDKHHSMNTIFAGQYASSKKYPGCFIYYHISFKYYQIAYRT